MKRTITYRILYFLIGLLLVVAAPLQADDNDILDRVIHLSKNRETIYHLLGEVSEQSGYLFIYDSKIINNEQIVKIPGGKYSVREAIYLITGNKELGLRVIGNHILISPPIETTPAEAEPVLPDSIRYFTLEGLLRDKYTNEPIPFATVGISEEAIGSITNQGGEFRLRLPDSLRQSQITFSHLGYQPLEMSASLLAERYSMLTLEPKVISLQEVVVRIANPLRLLREMQDKKEENYSQQPVYMTSFYREGIERKNKFVSLTEGIFKIYKTAYTNRPGTDQLKLLKMRRISSNQDKDTVIAKMKSGLNASLMLDVMKDMPDFLMPESEINYPYVFAHSDITVIDNRMANVISFEQRNFITLPLYKGNLYIDAENSALLRAEFELHPKYVKEAAGMLVEKKSRNLKITPQKVIYTVTYKPWNGTYYINHVRGDLHFKIKRKKQIFGSTPLHVWFEMVICKTDTVNVNRFTRKETLSTRTVFSETKFSYDEGFWGNFNVIPPEEKLNEAIGKISSKIEETGY
ncbi:STN and carboxypeptidase regulatory-like domain-containing protein [uncultured Parabacteroides sp.]|uniref:STN and carboxypeptidase regulatory-like domain-containing protein n=1 Tax=uncultured Parabacteroides sp. TaxID=512312 RepID=UPI0025FFB950|nr:STN and carboxypeptidase regulatory-like domain-containing protein [uncultured Parabacteroides sp.]